MKPTISVSLFRSWSPNIWRFTIKYKFQWRLLSISRAYDTVIFCCVCMLVDVGGSQAELRSPLNLVMLYKTNINKVVSYITRGPARDPA